MGTFTPSHYETPEERLKRMILEALDDARRADAEGHRKKFCIHIKHFILLMKAHMKDTVIDKIEESHKAMKAEADAIGKDGSRSIQEREKMVLDKEYEFFSQTLVDGIDALQNSRIMQKQMSGIILTGKTIQDMEDFGKRVRSSEAVETVLDSEEGILEGEEV